MPRINDDRGHESLIEQLRTGLMIDKNDLDSAWVEHPDMFYRVAQGLVMAISRRDEAKLDLANKIAELDQEIRGNAAAAQEKITEKSIEQEINTTPAVADLRKKYGQLSGLVDQWGALKEAYQQRSYALKDLVSLYQANYFSVQTGSRERAGAVEAKADDVRAEAGARRRERPITARS